MEALITSFIGGVLGALPVLAFYYFWYD